MFFCLDCLHWQMKENRHKQSDLKKPHQLTSVGELVFMTSPTLTCDGPREDSIEFVPVLFVAKTNQRCISWPKRQSWGRNGWIGHTTISKFTQLGPVGPGTAIGYKKKSGLGAPWWPELSSCARCRAAGPCGRSAPVELPDSGGALPLAWRLNTERRAASGHRPRECTATTGAGHHARDQPLKENQTPLPHLHTFTDLIDDWWLMDWLTDGLIDRWIDRLMYGLTDGLIDWCMDWLMDWLTDVLGVSSSWPQTMRGAAPTVSSSSRAWWRWACGPSQTSLSSTWSASDR